MVIKGMVEEDFANYKKACMFICFPHCSFKCERESGVVCCQNGNLARSPNIEINPKYIVQRYISNQITSAIVMGGLEPFDDWDDLYELVQLFRSVTPDDIVIYTGYDENEIQDRLECLKQYTNIIVKFGRFVPNSKHRFDNVLGVELASENQYARRI